MIDAAQRPLVWAAVGARRRRRRPRASWPSGSARPLSRRSVRRGVLPPVHPLRVPPAAARSPTARLRDAADLVVVVGSDLDEMMTQAFAMPRPRASRSTSTPLDASKNYRAGRRASWRRRRGRASRWPAAALPQRRSTRSAGACAACAPTAGHRRDRPERYLDAACAPADDARRRRRHVHPRLLDRGFTRSRRRDGWPTRLAGDARLRLPGHSGRAAATGPVVASRRRRLPVRLRRAGDRRPGADPTDHAPHRRRRLRDAALREGKARGRRFGIKLRTPDLLALAGSFGIRAETVDGLDDEFGEALARHVDDREPSVLVARTPEPLVPPPNTSPNWYRRRH